jgi:hypothetical protein
MLTNLDWLEKGAEWPPPSEVDRLTMYDKNRQLFENEHADVYKEDLKRIERVIGNFQEVVSYPVILNFQKLMSLKIADLLVGEPPIITAGDYDSAEDEAVKQIKLNSDLVNTIYESCIDISRYGDGLFYVRQEDGKGIIDVTQPPIWFPVVNPENIKQITYHVLAWEYELIDGDKKSRRVNVQIHSKGSYEKRVLQLTSSENTAAIRPVIGGLVEEPQTITTGLDDFAIIQVSNVITSDRVTGLDDYTDIDSVVSELLVRVGQVARILDKHASPSVQGPQTALEKDPATGEWKLKMGNYFPRDSKDDPEVGYITWDGHLAANFTHIEKLVNFLYTLSEMGSALFGDMSANTGQVPSGSALRRLLISPLAKVNRIRMRLDPAIKKAIVLCSQLKGENVIDLSKSDITITWQDGLPGDPVEESDIMAERTAGKATMSQRRALKTYDAMTDEEVEAEMALITEEEEASNPMPPFSILPPEEEESEE